MKSSHFFHHGEEAAPIIYVPSWPVYPHAAFPISPGYPLWAWPTQMDASPAVQTGLRQRKTGPAKHSSPGSCQNGPVIPSSSYSIVSPIPLLFTPCVKSFTSSAILDRRFRVRNPLTFHRPKIGYDIMVNLTSLSSNRVFLILQATISLYLDDIVREVIY